MLLNFQWVEIPDIEVVVVYGTPKMATQLYQIVNLGQHFYIVCACYCILLYIVVVLLSWTKWLPCLGPPILFKKQKWQEKID